MSPGIDPVEFGRAVAKLEQAVENIDQLVDRVSAMEDRFKFGKGGLVGLGLGLAFALYGVKATLGGIATKLLGDG